MRWARWLLVAGGTIVGTGMAAVGPGKSLEREEALLREAEVGTDTKSLLGFLEKKSGNERDLKQVKVLIEQLGHDEFTRREKAARKLIALELGSLMYLQREADHKDLEVRRRVRECIVEIEKKTQVNLPLAAVRLLVKRRAPGSVAVLMKYLPFTTDVAVEEAIYIGVNTLGVRGGTPDKMVVEALSDSMAARRALAACIVGRVGSKKQRERVRALLKDTESQVRLRAAQGLLARGDQAAVSPLIDLLSDPSLEVAWQAEELLRWGMASRSPPQAGLVRGTMAAREKVRQRWLRWWNAVKRTGPVHTSHPVATHPRMLLVTERYMQNGKEYGRVWLCGADGKVRWHLEKVNGPVAACHLPGAGVLVGERNGRAVVLHDLAGKVKWVWNDGSGDLQSISWRNGAVKIALSSGCRFSVSAVSPYGQSGDRRLGELRDQDIMDVRVDALGEVHCLVSSRMGGSSICSVDARTGRPIGSRKVAGRLGQQARLEVVNAKQYLVISDGRVVGVGDRGKMIQEWKDAEDHFIGALQFRDDSLLLVRESNCGVSVLEEYDSGGEKRWEVPRLGKVVDVSECFPLLSIGFRGGEHHGPGVGSVARKADQLRTGQLAERLFALHVLKRGGRGALSAVPDILERFADPSPEVRERVGATVEAIGDETIPFLQRALRHKKPEVRAGSLTALARFARNREEVIRSISTGLEDKDAGVRATAAWSLGKVGKHARGAIRELIRTLDDCDPEARKAAAVALGKIGPGGKTDLVRRLLRAARGADKELRNVAIEAIGELGPQAADAVPVLTEWAQSPEYEDAHRSIVAALGRMGRSARPALPQLTKMLKHRNLLVVEGAAKAIGAMGSVARGAVPELMSVLQCGREPSVQIAAARALGQIGGAAKRAIPVLRQIARETKDDELYYAAKFATARIEGSGP